MKLISFLLFLCLSVALSAQEMSTKIQLNIIENKITISNIGGEEGMPCTVVRTARGYEFTFSESMELSAINAQFSREPWPPIVLDEKNKAFWVDLTTNPERFVPKFENNKLIIEMI